MTCGSTLTHLADHLPRGSGPLGLLSGDEFRPEVRAFDEAILRVSGPRVGLVLCADHRAAPKSATIARAHFTSIGARVVDDDLVHGDHDPDVDVVYIGGGSPPELLTCLRDAWPQLERRWLGGTAIVGSSAGAMALCQHCLVPRPGAKAPTIWTEGVGPIRGVGLAVHASSRTGGWIERIARDAPGPVIALDDRTGIVLRHASEPLVLGEGSVWLAGGEPG